MSNVVARLPCGHCGGNHTGGKKSCRNPGRPNTLHATNAANFCGGCQALRAAQPAPTPASSAPQQIAPAQQGANGRNQYGVLRIVEHSFVVASSTTHVTNVVVSRSVIRGIEDEFARYGTLTMDRVRTSILPIGAGVTGPIMGTAWCMFSNTDQPVPDATRLTDSGNGVNIGGGQSLGPSEEFRAEFGRASRDLSFSQRSPPVPGLRLSVLNESNASVRVRMTIEVRGSSPVDPNAVQTAAGYRPEVAPATVRPNWVLVRDAVMPGLATLRAPQGARMRIQAGVLQYTATTTGTFAPLQFDGRAISVSATSYPGLNNFVPTVGVDGFAAAANFILWIGLPSP